MFHSLNIRTAQHSDVEHIVQGHFRSFNFRMILYNTNSMKMSRYIRYSVVRSADASSF